MKPRADHKYAHDDDQDELHVDSEPYVEAPKQAKIPHKVAPVTWGGDAAFLMFAGVAAVAIGVVLALGPQLSGELGKFAERVKPLGMQAGVLVMGGLALAALGLLRRGQRALRQPTTEQLEDRLILEQLTKDSLRAADVLARMESTLAHLESTLTESRRSVEERVTACAREVVAAIPPPTPPAAPDEAIFRLAASLDQVGMRIEQRLKTQYTALQDHIEDVGAAILSARNQMQGLATVGEHHVETLRQEVQTQVEKALEETGFWSGAQQANDGPSLGVLDTIEDHTAAGLPDVGSIDSALPIDPEEAREHGAAGGMPPGLMDVDTKTRLIQLSSLLADPKLRRALEGISGAGNSES